MTSRTGYCISQDYVAAEINTQDTAGSYAQAGQIHIHMRHMFTSHDCLARR